MLEKNKVEPGKIKMSFRNSLLSQPLPARTENGMASFVSTNDPVVDLFYHIGAMRGKNVLPLFHKAFNTDPILATKVALWARDIRGGAGERQLFRDILLYLEEKDPALAKRIIPKIPELGRWDDLLVFQSDDLKVAAYLKIYFELTQGKNGLLAKWMPRQGPQAVEIRNTFGWSPKRWRKTLVSLSSTVEQQMCAKDWNEINFDHVPSVAASRYQKAFKRNAKAAYETYVTGLKTGVRKINAGAVYPYDITKNLTHGNELVAQAQWDALPNFVGKQKYLPMVDVSGSMSGYNLGPNLTALDVAVALGLYFADKNTGSFKDVFCEFSSTASLHVLQGNLLAKFTQLRRMHWGMSTNLHGAFEAVLRHATINDISDEDMPEGILIFSDMQFNNCVSYDDTAYQMICRKYQNAGYSVPKVIFWNIASRNVDNAPVAFNQKGVALVSGYSPAVFKSIASGKYVSPRDIMLETINKPRYEL